MNKLKLIKENEVAVTKGLGVYCDFCGADSTVVFTSSFDDRKDRDERKCEMQICVECIKQLNKLVK